MVKIQQRRKAILLRKKGKSFSEIKKTVIVSKSTLSRWLKQYPLSSGQLKRINNKKYQTIEKYRITMQKKKNKQLEKIYYDQQAKLLPFTQKELIIAGLFLYWGEGNKANQNVVSINNTDPDVIKFALFWLMGGLNIPKSKIKVYLHLYQDMNVKKEMDYWSRALGIPTGNFIKPYIKNSSRLSIDQKGFGHGTCGLIVYDTTIKTEILMGVKSIADYYSKKIANICYT